MSFNLDKLLRSTIKNLAPYSSARDEFSGEASIYIDANENPFESGVNRYPDPMQIEVKRLISDIKGVPIDNIFLGNGSDEPIDLLFRALCNPGVDNYVAIAPTYGMYRVSADINDIECREVLLDSDYSLNSSAVLEAVDKSSKLIFLCSPNNPTGNSLDRSEIVTILENFSGVVVVDEAYIDFSTDPSFTELLSSYPNLLVLQTLSKAWGLAGIRLGMAFASTDIIGVLNKIKYPYNINVLTQQRAIEALKSHDKVLEWVEYLNRERELLRDKLEALDIVKRVYPSQSNFLLINIENATAIYIKLQERGIIVRDRSRVVLCKDSLRISIGTSEENRALIEALKTL